LFRSSRSHSPTLYYVNTVTWVTILYIATYTSMTMSKLKKDTFKQYKLFKIHLYANNNVMLVYIIFRAGKTRHFLLGWWNATQVLIAYIKSLSVRYWDIWKTLISECIITTVISCKSIEKKLNRYHFFFCSHSNGNIISEFLYINKGL
jgi:hypothetical protein